MDGAVARVSHTDSSDVSELDWRFKSWPTSAPAMSFAELAASGWSILDEDVTLPAAVLHASALRHNSDWMRRFTAATGVEVAPHGKTTMSPELIQMQLEDGAWGITAATVAQLKVYRQHGLGRVILANQLIGRQACDYVVGELLRDPDFDFYCLVDSIAAVEQLERRVSPGLRGSGRRIQVLLELGIEGGRTGVREDDEALRIAQRIASSESLCLRGVESFEGIVQGDGPSGEHAVRTLLSRMIAIAEQCDGVIEGRPILTAGGSSFFDLVADAFSAADNGREYEIVLRSGCYLIHDSQFYEQLVKKLLARSAAASGLGEGLRPALELWSYVQARPESRRVIAGLGKRDTSADAAQPVPLRWYRPGGSMPGPLPVAEGSVVVRLDDHHAYLDVPQDSPLQVGDMIAFGISHPCTTFDRWPYLYLVDDQLGITGAVRTYF